VVHNLVHEKLKADKKVARQKKQRARASAETSKELAQKLTSVFKEVKAIKKFKRVRYWCEDETRLGLRTSEKKVDIQGVKPGSLQFSEKILCMVSWNLKVETTFSQFSLRH